jgi:hypothetical protein
MEEKYLKKIKIKMNKVEKIYNDYKKTQIKHGGSFNICSILRKHNDEVNLHSKFIYELINPNGSHQQEDKFLRLFIEEALELKDFEFNELKIKREDLTDENKRIDFTIESSNYLIGIEMKIDAGDQNKQMYSYYEELKKRNRANKPKKNIKLFYLTRYGNEPSNQSIHILKSNQYNLLSFSIDIKWWLDKCIEQTNIIKLKESIKQYLEIVYEITGQKPEDIEKKMDTLVKNEKDIELIHTIIEDYPRIWAKREVEFWNGLYKRVKNINIDGLDKEDIVISLYCDKDDDYKFEMSDDDRISILKYYRHHIHRCKFGVKIDLVYNKHTFTIIVFKRDDNYSKIDVTVYGIRGGTNKNQKLKETLNEQLDFLPELIFYAKDIDKPTFDLFEENKFNNYLTKARKEIKQVLQVINDNKDDIVK